MHCRNPTCQQPAARAGLDHTIPYQPDGTTSQHNLPASCRHHHRLKTHVPGWHAYTSHPHTYQPDPHPPPETNIPETDPDPPPF